MMRRVGWNRISAPYLTVYLVMPLSKTPHMHRIYIYTYGALPTQIMGTVHDVLGMVHCTHHMLHQGT